MKSFTTTGVCVPAKHYMVDISERLAQIKTMIDEGKYFTINRGRQYGKTTTLTELKKYLKPEYYIIGLDFQSMGTASFRTEEDFVRSFCRALLRIRLGGTVIPPNIEEALNSYMERREQFAKLDELGDLLTQWCAESDKRIVMMIDEVDSASNNQVFLDFLAMLRIAYLNRDTEGIPAFQSVILAGVTDIKNLKRKIRPDEDHRFNSPWNIASEFTLDMDLSVKGITGMLNEYEKEHSTGMDTDAIAREIHSYTGGYPFLVSRVCQLIDTKLINSSERFSALSEAWTVEGISEAVRMLMIEKNTLFDSLMGKVYDNSDLSKMLKEILFAGNAVSYNLYNITLSDAEMYGFIRNDNGKAVISNRCFETLLYNYFLSTMETRKSDISSVGINEQSSFILDGHLQMEKLLKRYAEVFNELYGNKTGSRFDEEEGRLRFLLFIRPVINGTGNYYIEASTRDNQRMDLVIDYLGERFVVELKIWRGRAYHENGEKQLSGYLKACKLDKGYMLTYNFNNKKAPGISRSTVDGKEIIEVMV